MLVTRIKDDEEGEICRGMEAGGHHTAGRPSLSLTSCLCIPTIIRALSSSNPGKDTDGQKWSYLEHGSRERGCCVNPGFLPSCLYPAF